LIERVAAPDESLRMPPEGEPLTPEEIRLLESWIDHGAPASDDEQPDPDPQQHWAFQTPQRPTCLRFLGNREWMTNGFVIQSTPSSRLNTGRHKLDDTQLSIGAWTSYGPGTLNENLSQFVVLGGPTRADTRQSFEADYLGPPYAGVPLTIGGKLPLPYGRRDANVKAEEQRHEFALIRSFNKLSGVE